MDLKIRARNPLLLFPKILHALCGPNLEKGKGIHELDQPLSATIKSFFAWEW